MRKFLITGIFLGFLMFIQCTSTPLLTGQGVVKIQDVPVGVNQNYLYASGGYREFPNDKQTIYQIWVVFFNDPTNLETIDPERFTPGSDYPSGEYLLISIESEDLNRIVSQNGYTFEVNNQNQAKNAYNYFEVSMDLGSTGAQAQGNYTAIGKVGTISAAIHLQGTKLTFFDGSFSMDFDYPDFLEGDFSVSFEE